MPTLTLGALVAAEPALQRIGQQPVTSRTAYHLVKVTTLVAAETALFRKQRETLFRTYGVERDATPLEALQGGPRKVIEVTVEKQPAFQAQMDELSSIAVEITTWQIPMAMLEEIKISAADLLALGDLIRPE